MRRERLKMPQWGVFERRVDERPQLAVSQTVRISFLPILNPSPRLKQKNPAQALRFAGLLFRMAERKRFELLRGITLCSLSKGVPSTTRPSLRTTP